MEDIFKLKQESPPVENRKRHTTRNLTCSSITCLGRYPVQSRGFPRRDMRPVTGALPFWEGTWDQCNCYGMEMGTPPERTCDQWNYYGMEMEYPLPHGGQSENTTFRHPSDASGKYYYNLSATVLKLNNQL